MVFCIFSLSQSRDDQQAKVVEIVSLSWHVLQRSDRNLLQRWRVWDKSNWDFRFNSKTIGRVAFNLILDMWVVFIYIYVILLYLYITYQCILSVSIYVSQYRDKYIWRRQGRAQDWEKLSKPMHYLKPRIQLWGSIKSSQLNFNFYIN